MGVSLVIEPADPFWLAFAWLYELTPEGLKRESDVGDTASITAVRRANSAPLY